MSFLNLKKPSAAALQRFTEVQCAKGLSYLGPYMTEQRAPPPGFAAKRTRAQLGAGEEVFRRAVAGLKTWAVYPAWMSLYPQRAPIEVGTCVAIATSLGVHTLSAVQVIDVQETPSRFSFTLGTLPQHAVSGEERFSVTRDEEGRVWFEIKAFSKPQHPLVKLGSPVLRLVQRRFARDSVRSLRAFLG